MYDTTNGILLLDSHTVNQIKPLINKMQSSTINYGASTQTYSGNLENIRIKINEHSVRFDGSLSKFGLGNNIQSLDLNTTKLAIEKFSDLIGLPMKNAKIHRLDFAQNLSVSYPPISYYMLFGETKYLVRLEQGTGLYYRNTRRELVFYDKGKDVRQMKQTIDPKFALQRLLRFEVRLKGHSNICKYFNIPDLSMERLYDPLFYRNVIIAWGSEYEKIEKYNDMPVFDDRVFSSPSKLVNQLIQFGIHSIGGRKQIVNLLKNARQRGVFKKDANYFAIQKKLRDLNKIEDLSVKNELIVEVNSKVKDFVLNSNDVN